MNGEDVGRRVQHHYRREILHRVVRHLLKQRHVRAVGHAADQQRVTVSRCARNEFRTNIGAPARPVLHEHRAAQCVREFLRDRAADKISAAAWYIRDD
jgi:hypothetical protein